MTLTHLPKQENRPRQGQQRQCNAMGMDGTDNARSTPTTRQQLYLRKVDLIWITGTLFNVQKGAYTGLCPKFFLSVWEWDQLKESRLKEKSQSVAINLFPFSRFILSCLAFAFILFYLDWARLQSSRLFGFMVVVVVAPRAVHCWHFCAECARPCSRPPLKKRVQ